MLDQLVAHQPGLAVRAPGEIGGHPAQCAPGVHIVPALVGQPEHNRSLRDEADGTRYLLDDHFADVVEDGQPSISR
jgi:hypothetical protein